MKRVLIAEDEPNIVLSLEFLLQEAGYEVLTAVNGAKALELAEAHRPDLIVLDVMLPLVNGYEVCRSIRANGALKDTRVLMLTARGREHEVARGLALGANAYMTKPFATRELMRIVEELIGPARTAQ
jgi:two-component system alkaline phosphatase synthesis response regulator PhoP